MGSKDMEDEIARLEDKISYEVDDMRGRLLKSNKELTNTIKELKKLNKSLQIQLEDSQDTVKSLNIMLNKMGEVK